MAPPQTDTISYQGLNDLLPPLRPISWTSFPELPRRSHGGYIRSEAEDFVELFSQAIGRLQPDELRLIRKFKCVHAAAKHLDCSRSLLERTVLHDGIVLRAGKAQRAWLISTLDSVRARGCRQAWRRSSVDP